MPKSTTSESLVNNTTHIASIFIISIGLVGNFFVAMVYSSQSLRKFSMSTYFLFISFFDTLPLVDYFLIYLRDERNVDIAITSNFWCKLKSYTTFTIGAISPWLMVLVSLDRFFSIYFIRMFPIFDKLKFQLSLIAAIVMFNGIFYLQWMWSSHLVVVVITATNTTTSSIVVCDITGAVSFWMDLFNSSIVPFLLMIVLSLAIIGRVRQSRKRSMASNLRKISRRDRKFAITSITLNLVFLGLSLPSVTYNLITYYLRVESTLNITIANFINMLYYVYYASGFYVQIVVNSVFRDAFLSMLNLKEDATNSLTRITL